MIRSLLPVMCLFAVMSSSEVRAVEIGESVLAFWEDSDAYFLGTVVEKTKGGYLVIFEDGDSAEVPENKISKNIVKAGTAVVARWEDGNYYPGKVSKIVGRAYYIKYDDGDEGWVPAAGIALKREQVER